MTVAERLLAELSASLQSTPLQKIDEFQSRAELAKTKYESEAVGPTTSMEKGRRYINAGLDTLLQQETHRLRVGALEAKLLLEQQQTAALIESDKRKSEEIARLAQAQEAAEKKYKEELERIKKEGEEHRRALERSIEEQRRALAEARSTPQFIPVPMFGGGGGGGGGMDFCGGGPAAAAAGAAPVRRSAGRSSAASGVRWDANVGRYRDTAGRFARGPR